MKKELMECIGTFFFVFTVAATGNPFAIAAMLMAWVYIGGYISGGHYNPAVSLAVALRGRLEWDEARNYMIAQILGGIIAFAMTSYFYGHITIPKPGLGISLLQAFIMEVLLACVLALVVLTVATTEKFKESHVFGFAIGFTIPALAALGGPISGGLFNPAIPLGAAIVGAFKRMPISYEHLAMYVVGALLGGFLAAYLFTYFHTQDNR
jgi:aquaporin Z